MDRKGGSLSGLTFAVNAIVPMEAGMAIVLWIGIIITAQAFDSTPREHAPAVAIGLFPAIAAWGLWILSQTLNAANIATGDFGLAADVLAKPDAFEQAGLHLHGLVATSQGFMLTCMVWAAASTMLIERQFVKAALWLAVGAGFSFFGFGLSASRLCSISSFVTVARSSSICFITLANF